MMYDSEVTWNLDVVCKNICEYIELVRSSNDDSKYNDVILVGDEKMFDKLKEFGFPLENYRYKQLPYDELKIVIIPKYELRPSFQVKPYFEEDD